jgi:hypothetical protein
VSIQTSFEIIDYAWSVDGDFELRGGDIATTSTKRGKGFLQEVRDILMSSTGDWLLDRQRGANIDAFIGEVNSSNTRTRIEESIKFALTKDGFLEKQDFIVTAARASTTQTVVRIDFDTSLTDGEANSTIQFNIVYDTDGKGPYIIR